MPKARLILVAQVKADPPKEWRKTSEPKVGFACIGGACNLSALWDGSDISEYVFLSPKPPAGDLVARTELVTLSMIRAH